MHHEQTFPYRDMHVDPVDRVTAVYSSPFSQRCSRQWKDGLLSCSYFSGKLDRVNVLGSETTGHTGCVNALSWARAGSVLISSGDDTTYVSIDNLKLGSTRSHGVQRPAMETRSREHGTRLCLRMRHYHTYRASREHLQCTNASSFISYVCNSRWLG